MKWQRPRIRLLTLVVLTTVVGAAIGIYGRTKDRATISGVVTRGGKPVANAYVLLSGNRGSWYITGTRSDGTYRLGNCPVDNYRIWAGPRAEWESLMSKELANPNRKSLLLTPTPSTMPLTHIRLSPFRKNRIDLSIK